MSKQLQSQVLEILDRAITEPSAGDKKKLLARANGQIAVLEAQLGLEHKLMPILNVDRAGKRLAELQGQLAAKNATGTPAAAVPPIAPEPKDEPSGSGIVDATVKATGSQSLAEFRRKAERRRLSAAVAALPANSISRRCAEANLQSL